MSKPKPHLPCPTCKGSGEIPNPAFVGADCRKIRKKLKLTLRQLSERMGVSIGYLSDLEQGRKQWGDPIYRRWREAISSG